MKLFAKSAYAQGLLDGASVIVDKVTGFHLSELIKTNE